MLAGAGRANSHSPSSTLLSEKIGINPSTWAGYHISPVRRFLTATLASSGGLPNLPSSYVLTILFNSRHLRHEPLGCVLRPSARDLPASAASRAVRSSRCTGSPRSYRPWALNLGCDHDQDATGEPHRRVPDQIAPGAATRAVYLFRPDRSTCWSLSVQQNKTTPAVNRRPEHALKTLS